MLKVVGCLTDAHDYWLVGLAAAICALASITCVELLRHARAGARATQAAWLGVTAVAGGSGIWATHFVAMLAFEPGLPSAYDGGLTGMSLVVAVILSGVGLRMALARPAAVAPAVGGAILGTGIAAMHYTGMAAFEIAGHVEWDPELVAASLALGGLFGGLSLATALGGDSLKRRISAASLLLLAICGHHFVAMGAVTIVPDPGVAISESAVPARWLAGAVALASMAILSLACAALALDVRDRRKASLERERLTSLANAAVEGLVVCSGDTIVSANDSFGRLVGRPAIELVGSPLSRYLPCAPLPAASIDRADEPTAADLMPVGSTPIPVELIVRPVSYGDRPHHAVAVRDVRARRRAEGRIEFLAHHDALTGLANRASFAGRLAVELAAAEATGRRLAVLCLDLDRFKEVNDLFGHAAGDAILVRVARSVTALLDDTQLMARLGGDEFAVLMPCDGGPAAGLLAERILDALRPGDGEAGGAPIGTSIGIALYPDAAAEPASLLGHADTALYEAKSDGRGTYRFFEPRMGSRVRERRLLEHDVRHAVQMGELHLAYQPQTDVRTGTVLGFEALLRWRHPVRGDVPPGDFIPVAEETGAILQIGEWVLREACREAAGWPNPLTVAVNVSGVQLHAPRFAQLVHAVLLDTGLGARRLEIEITETALVRDPGRAQSTLRQLKALGVRIAMDDFGTGYSSLSNLRLYPFDRIKIDGSFIRSVDGNEQAAAIVRSVLGLGRGLRLPVLAEGVETEAELGFLAGEDCHAAQGYLMGRPAGIGAFERYTHGASPVAVPPSGTAHAAARTGT